MQFSWMAKMRDTYSYCGNLSLDNSEESDMKRSGSFKASRKSGPQRNKQLKLLGSQIELAQSTEPTYHRTDCKQQSSDMQSCSDNISRKKTSRIDCDALDKSISNKSIDVFEVVRKGTKLMKSLNFPTVIVKLLNGNFDKSKVYYVILEPETKELKGEIQAVMFSNPDAYSKTRFAELLPLVSAKYPKSGCLTPMLSRKRYKRVFRRGRSFKIKLLSPGRAIDGSSEYLWNRYDLTKINMQNLLREFLHVDIRHMFHHLTSITKPIALRTNSSKLLKNKATSPPKNLLSTGRPNLGKREIYQVKTDFKPSRICSKENKEGCCIADNSQTMTPRMNMDNDFKYATGAIFQRDTSKYFEELDKHWCCSAELV